MKLLVITSVFPLPLDRGGPVRIMGLLGALATEHHVHLLAIQRRSTTEELRLGLQAELGGEVEVFDPQPRDPGRTASVRRWARALYDGVPPWVSADHSRDLERRAGELAADADAVVLLDEYAGIYAAGVSHLAPVIADKHNVMGASATDDSPLTGHRGRVHRMLTIHLSRRFERDYLRHTTRIVVTSADEGTRLKQLYGRTADAVVPSAVDMPPEMHRGEVNVVGWLGTHEYEANVDGLMRFVTEGWATLGRDGTRLLIAGGSPPPRVRELERFPGVEILGYVKDLDGFLGGLSAAVVPIWKGAGVKVKTLTFMGAGLPLAATPGAVEGIDAQSGRHFLVADDPRGLAQALRELIDDPERAGRMGAEARVLIAERYTWEKVGPRFCEAVERAASTQS